MTTATTNGATCRCGQWPIEEYGPRCPSCDLWVAGDRVVLDFSDDEFTSLRPGDRGTVSFVDSLGTVHVRWDSGSRLGLVPDHDRWHREGA